MLKDDYLLFLNILKESLQGRSYQMPMLSNDSFTCLMKTARDHQLLPLVCETVYASKSLQKDIRFSSYRHLAINSAATQIIRTEEFLSLLQSIQEAGLDPVVVKGIICQGLYSKSFLRISMDDDLFVPDGQFADCHQFLLEYGMTPDSPVIDFNQADEISYHMEGSPLYVELHRSLFTEGATAYGSLNRFFTHSLEYSVRIQARNTNIRTLSPTDHLLYLILHAYKHFLYSGIGIRPVCDIGLFAEKYREEIDWTYIEECLISANAFDYTRGMLHIIDRYLLPDSLFLKDITNWNIASIDEEPLLEDILASGIHGASSMARLHSSNITLSAVSNGKKGGVLHSVFLPLKSMKGKYPYLQGRPYLLPVAWLQRIYSYLRETKKQPSDNTLESIRIGNDRVKLFEQYHIIVRNNKPF